MAWSGWPGGYPREVVSAERVATGRLPAVQRSAAQQRILDAALTLIADHGVGGTSLQMIADAIGVTKAAVYHQFKTKEEIVIALTERELGRLDDALVAAEAEASARAREVLLTRVIDMAIERRRAAATLQFDPVVIRLLADHFPFQQFLTRLYGVLLGDAEDQSRVSAAMLAGAIGTAVTHPLVADIDDDELRTELLLLTRRLLELPE